MKMKLDELHFFWTTAAENEHSYLHRNIKMQIFHVRIYVYLCVIKV